MTDRRGGGFITFEGGEGVGKSTQVTRLAERIMNTGHAVVATREPGGSLRAERIRTAILSGGVAPLGAAAEAVMFSAARLDHVETLIRPALGRGAFVVCDRFIDSTRAYQGAVGQTAPALIDALERVVIGECRPTLTILLDLPADVGLDRARRRRGIGAEADRFEGEADAFHIRLRAAFLEIAAHEPGRMMVIDAAAGPDIVAEAVWATVISLFPTLRSQNEAPVGRTSP